jgi:hypothetical protein
METFTGVIDGVLTGMLIMAVVFCLLLYLRR